MIGGVVDMEKPNRDEAADLSKAMEEFRRANPELGRAIDVFEISDREYKNALDALYGPHISWTNALNRSAR